MDVDKVSRPRGFKVKVQGLLLVVGLAWMAGCATAPTETKESKEASTQAQYKEAMQSAEDAYKQGEPGSALVQLEKAAKLDPAKKQPWLRMAQMHFDARNYGPAIIAAQEVQLRDNTDITAKTIIAASGLRVAAKAVEQLRAANVAVTDTINEARAMSKTMRDVLGEPLLPPATEVDLMGQPVNGSPKRWSTPQGPQGGAAQAPRPAPPQPVAQPAPPSARTAPAPAPRPSGSGRNPFDVLVKE